MADLEKIGVQAVVEGFDDFMKKLDAMGLRYEATSKRFKDAQNRFATTPPISLELMDILNSLDEEVEKNNSGLGKFVKALGGAGAAATGTANKISGVAKFLSGLSGILGTVGVALGGVVAALGGPAGVAVAIAATVLYFKGLGLVLKSIKAILAAVVNTIKGTIQAFFNLGKAVTKIAFEMVKNITKAFFDMVKNITKAFFDMGKSIISSTVEAVTAVGEAISQATSLLIKLGIAAVKTAGEYQALEFAAIAIGQAVGYSATEIRKQIDLIKEVGVRGDIAALVVAQLARNHVDLSNAVELAKAAQGGAILINTTTSAAFERLNRAIITGNSWTLRRMEILTDLLTPQEALNKGLTDQERIQENINRVLAQSAVVMGVYTATLQSPTRLLQSLSDRIIPNLLAKLGDPFLGAVSTVIQSITDLAQSFTVAISEGGSLYYTMVQLGAIASIVADAIGGAIDKIAGLFGVAERDAEKQFSKFGTLIVESKREFIDEAIDWAADAAIWGAEIITQFAVGMAKAATTVLIEAMNAISSILAWFLSPGSPPRIAPHIDKWGAATLTEWLKGFSKADFSVLSGIGGVLKSFLSGPEMQGLAAQLIEALAGFRETGALDEAFFIQLKEAGGEFGAEIVELARRHFELATAVDKVTEAERELEAAQDAVTGATTAVSALTKEYNNLLRAGASKEVLNAQFAQIKAAEKAQAEALLQHKAAEQNLEDAKEQEDALKERLSLQEDLVRQLLELRAAETPAQKEARVKKERETGGGGSIADQLAEMLGGGGGGAAITSSISEAIDNAKIILKEKLDALWLEIRGIFTAGWEQIKTDMRVLGVDLGKIVDVDWRNLLTDPVGEISKLLTGQTLTDFETFADNVGKTTVAIGVFAGKIGDFVTNTKPFIDDVGKFIEDVGKFTENLGKAIENVKTYFEDLGKLREEIARAFSEIDQYSLAPIATSIKILSEGYDDLRDIIDRLFNPVQKPGGGKKSHFSLAEFDTDEMAGSVEEAISGLQTLFTEQLATVFAPVLEQWNIAIGELVADLIRLSADTFRIWRIIKFNVRFWADQIGLILTDKMPTDISTLQTAFDTFKEWLRDEFATFIVEVFIPEALQPLLDKLVETANYIKDDTVDAWTELVKYVSEDVVKLFEKNGTLWNKMDAFTVFVLTPLRNMLRMIIQGFKDVAANMIDFAKPEETSTTGGASSSVAAKELSPTSATLFPTSFIASQPVMSPASVRIGPINNYNGMDEAATVAVVKREIRRQMGA